MASKAKRASLTSSRNKKAAFLAAFAQCGVVTRAAEMAKVSRRSHSKWMLADPHYVTAFAEAEQESLDRLETAARIRAHDGLQRLKFYKGEPIMVPSDPKDPGSPKIPYVEHEYSDTLIMFLLNGGRPEKFKHNVDMTSGGKPIAVKILRDVSMDDL